MSKPKDVKWLCAFGFHFWKRTDETIYSGRRKYVCRRGCGCVGSYA